MIAAIVASLRQQSEGCAELGSDLYARLLAAAADDVEVGGPVAALLEGWEGEPLRAALPLRMAAGVHALVLGGAAPELAAHYPTAGGSPAWPACRDAFLRVVAEHASGVRPWLHLDVQTNEPLRSSVLLGGFLTVAWETGLPLRLLELGASAGLNLCFDRYRHRLGGDRVWGPPDSSAVLTSDWSGGPPPLRDGLPVAERAACDAAPLDAAAATDRLRLRAYVWGDQPHRLARLDGALAAVALNPPHVERAQAGAWLAGRLADQGYGVATVVYHSVVWAYLGEAGQQEVAAMLAAAGRRATPGAPLHWLRMEPQRGVGTELTLTSWPGGKERKLADCHAHGAWARWAQPA